MEVSIHLFSVAKKQTNRSICYYLLYVSWCAAVLFLFLFFCEVFVCVFCCCFGKCWWCCWCWCCLVVIAVFSEEKMCTETFVPLPALCESSEKCSCYLTANSQPYQWLSITTTQLKLRLQTVWNCGPSSPTQRAHQSDTTGAVVLSNGSSSLTNVLHNPTRPIQNSDAKDSTVLLKDLSSLTEENQLKSLTQRNQLSENELNSLTQRNQWSKNEVDSLTQRNQWSEYELQSPTQRIR